MRVDVGSPYNCIKIALRYALGNILRPNLADIQEKLVTFRNDKEEVVFEFPDLNYEYVNRIAIEDIKSFGQEEFGKFFYEYGRVLLANLVIAFTHLDWYAYGEKARNELRFVGEYYDELLKLNGKASEVLDAFIDMVKIKKSPVNPYFDFLRASLEIIKAKQDNTLSLENHDMKNTHIMVLSYVGIWFTIIGYLLLFCQKIDVDGLSRLLAASESKENAKLFIKSIVESQEEDSKKINICSLIFTFFNINRYYLITSGLTIQDPLLELLGKFSSHVMDLIKDEEDLVIIDEDLITGNSDNGPSIAAFTNNFNPLRDIGEFGRFGILRSDNTNIWSFGKEYVTYYVEETNPDFVSLPSLMEPSLVKYIDKYAPISSYFNSDNIDIEKSFLFIKNIITGIERELIGVACPGTILQLTIIGATYRTIRQSSGFSRLSHEKKTIIEAGIDIIDIIIVLLYELWFLSGKFFIQPKRPNYIENTAVNTLEQLRGEVLIILEEYLEFVHFGKSNHGPLFQEIIRQRLIHKDNITTQDIVTKYHPVSDQNVYITECAKHNIYSIVYSVLCSNINPPMTIQGLAYNASKVPLDESIIRSFSRYVEGGSDAYIDVPMLDSMLKAYPVIKEHIMDKPENYIIAVYALLYETIEQLLIKNSVGNYFDFNKVDNLTSSYKLETIVSELVKKPLHINLGRQHVNQKLTPEQERSALW
jgi:hypothetical protein